MRVRVVRVSEELVVRWSWDDERVLRERDCERSAIKRKYNDQGDRNMSKLYERNEVSITMSNSISISFKRVSNASEETTRTFVRSPFPCIYDD